MNIPGHPIVFVAMAACSAPESPLSISLAPLDSSPTGRTSTAALAANSATVASALPQAEKPPLSSEPPEDDMVDVPAGSFWMGCAQGDLSCREDEKPRHKVTLDAFQIDRLEVTVEQYRTCLHVGACKATDPGRIYIYPGGLRPAHPKDCNFRIAGRSNHGMNCVDPGEALEYCKWLGKRMPTEAEWERAARGTDDRIYPWGNEPPDPARICLHRSASCPVGSFPEGASPSGALDMGGNLAEWVWDTYTENYYAHSPSKNPQGPDTIKVPYWLWCHTVQCQAARGRTARVSERWGLEDERMEEIGFRCARDAPQDPSVAP
jgi:formylglycine-generating enzyme required for sulfatase activity